MASSKISGKNALLVCSQEDLIGKIQGLIGDILPEITLEVANTGAAGLTQVYQTPPSIIVVDATLPDMSGQQLCRVLKHDPAIRKLPIILITAEDTSAYVRYNEVSLIADMFLEESNIDEKLGENIKSLLELFSGLESTELEQLKLLQQQPVQVNAANRMVQLLDQSVTEVTIMKNFRKLFELVHNKNLLVHMLFSMLSNILDYDVAAVFFNDKTPDPRLLTFQIQKNWEVKEHQLELWTQRVFDDLKLQSNEQWLFSSYRHEILHQEHPDEPRALHSANYRSIYPFFIENTLVGALMFFNKHKVNYEMIFPFELVLQEMSALMRIRRYHTQAEMFAISDTETGLYTYQYFLWHLEREIREAKRHENPLTIACISIDEFRELMMPEGRDMADAAIKNLADASLETFRSVDFVSRFKGLTVMALMPNTAASAARLAINRLRKMVGKKTLKDKGKDLEMTITVGIASLSQDTRSAADLIEKAEVAHERACQKGRNCIELVQ